MNQTRLLARVSELSPLRYTPAGVPALNLTLEHASQVVEAGQNRQVQLVLKSVALGALAETLARVSLGSEWRFSGFLATSKKGTHPIFHIQDIESITF